MSCHPSTDVVKLYDVWYAGVPSGQTCPRPNPDTAIDSAMGRLLTDAKAHCAQGRCPDGKVCGPRITVVRAKLGRLVPQVQPGRMTKCRVRIEVKAHIACECMTPFDLKWSTFPHVEPLPGEDARSDRAYGALPQRHRTYWETGANGGLTAKQREKLEDRAWKAARFRGRNRYDDDLPRKRDGSVDHGQLVRQVKEYADAALSPDRDLGTVPAPPRPLGGIIDVCGTPENPKPPPDNPTNDPAKPSWVCINHATYAAALFRALGYPVREINVKLTQTTLLSGGNTYQEAALQVWFDGAWHYVDPYLCIYTPEETLGRYSDWTDFHTFYWDGTSTPTNWRPPRGDTPGGWRPLPQNQVGGDLQRRFYPPKRESARLVAPRLSADLARRAVLAPDRGAQPIAHASDRAEGSRSGLAIVTPTPGVRLSLEDSAGRMAAVGRLDLPGAIHLPDGLPVPYSKQIPDESDPTAPPPPASYQETVFFGTRGVIAEHEEIGEHALTLHIEAEPGTTVALQIDAVRGEHLVRARGLSESVELGGTGSASIPFHVSIEPREAATHVALELMLEKKLIEPWEYRVAMEKLDTARDAAAEAAEHPVVFEKPVTAPADEPPVIVVDPPPEVADDEGADPPA